MGTLNATEFTVVSEVLRRASLQLQAEASVKSRANQAVIMPSLRKYIQLIIQIELGKIFLSVSSRSKPSLNHFHKTGAIMKKSINNEEERCNVLAKPKARHQARLYANT